MTTLQPIFFVVTENVVRISFDPPKRDETLHERRLDFADAPKVFAGSISSLSTTGTIMASNVSSPLVISMNEWL